MDKFFSIFGKISLVLLVLGILIFSAYYFGKQSKNVIDQSTPKTSNVSTEQLNSLATSSATPLTTIVAGLPKSAGLSFDQYSIMTPSDWSSKKESQTALDEKLILEKNGYIVSIFQAATGGALCLYPNDPEFEGPSSRFTKFVNLTTKDNRNLRRSGEGVAFTVCQKSADGSYQQPTNYGHISIKIPDNWNQKELDEIDQIISSLKKI